MKPNSYRDRAHGQNTNQITEKGVLKLDRYRAFQNMEFDYEMSF